MRNIIALMCVCYVLWRPVSNGAVLYPVLALLTALAVSMILTGERRVAKPFILTAYLLVVAGLIATLVGSINAAPGLTQQAIVWFGSIVIWGPWAMSLTRDRIRLTLNVLVFATIFLSGLIVLYIGAQQGLLPSLVPQSFLSSQDAGFDLTADGSAIRLLGLSTLAAAGPLVSSALVSGRDTYLPSRKLLALATVLSVVAAFVAGRRAIAVVTIVSPLLTLLLLRFLRPQRKGSMARNRPARWVLASPLLVVAGFIAWRLDLVARPLAALADGLHVLFGFGASDSFKGAGDLVRVRQSRELIAAWGEKPLFGHGLGAVLPDGFNRSPERPWMFELQYHDLLFTCGLVGAGLVLLALFSACIGIRRAAAMSPEHVPTLVATSVAALSMLVANASNPYLQAVGHVWSVALVLGVANALLRPRAQPDVAVDDASSSRPADLGRRAAKRQLSR